MEISLSQFIVLDMGKSQKQSLFNIYICVCKNLSYD